MSLDSRPTASSVQVAAICFAILLVAASSIGASDDVVSEKTFAVVAGDLNSDGLDDLALSASRKTCPYYPYDVCFDFEEIKSGIVYVRLQDAEGRLRLRGDYGIVHSPRALALGDVDGDGLVDVASAHDVREKTVSILTQKPDKPGKLHKAARLVIPGNAFGVALADIDSAGGLDLVLASPVGGLSVLYHQPGPGVSFLTPVQLAPVAKAVGVSDLDGNGLEDIACADGERVLVFLNGADPGTLEGREVEAGPGPAHVAIGDIDGDGMGDLAVTNADAASGAAWISVLLQDPERPGEFLPPAASEAPAGTFRLAVGDLDGDGRDDAAAIGDDLEAVVCFSRDGALVPTDGLALRRRPSDVALGDFDSDGLLDIAVAERGLSKGAEIFLQDPGSPGTFLPGRLAGK